MFLGQNNFPHLVRQLTFSRFSACARPAVEGCDRSTDEKVFSYEGISCLGGLLFPVLSVFAETG